jgi:hypothetical protein
MDHAIRLGALVPPCAARPTQPICAVKTVRAPIVSSGMREVWR